MKHAGPATGDASPRLAYRLRRALRRPAALPAAACAIFFAFHLTLVAVAQPDVDWVDEQELGLLARHLDTGLLGPLGAYRFNPREGGTLPVVFWLLPFFALLGPSAFTVKVGAVAFATLALLPWVALARRTAGPVGAGVMALGFILPVPHYLHTLSIAGYHGTHLGAFLFAGIAVYLLHRGFHARDLQPGRAAAALGATLGLGCLWLLTFAPIAAGVGLLFLARRPRPREVALFAAAALPGVVGAVFWCLLPGVRFSRGVLSSLAAARAGAPLSVTEILDAVRHVLTEALPSFTAPADTVPWPHIGPVYFAIAAASLAVVAALAWRGDRQARRGLSLQLPVALHVTAFTFFIAGIVDIASNGRYLMPITPFLMLAVAQAVAILARRRPRRAPWLVGAALAAGVAGVGVAATTGFMSVGPGGAPLLATPGHAPARFPFRDIRWVERALATAGRDDYEFLAYALGALRGDWPPPEGDVPGLARALWPAYWTGVGARDAALLAHGDGDGEMIARKLRAGPGWTRRAYARGLGWAYVPTAPVFVGWRDELYAILKGALQPRLAAATWSWVAPTIAAAIAEVHVVSRGYAPLAGGIDEVGVEPVLDGLARGIAWQTLEDADEVPVDYIADSLRLSPRHTAQVARRAWAWIERRVRIADAFVERPPYRGRGRLARLPPADPRRAPADVAVPPPETSAPPARRGARPLTPPVAAASMDLRPAGDEILRGAAPWAAATCVRL